MHVAYLFDRVLPATETDSEQVIRTVAALGRRGVRVTLIVPDGRAPGADARALRDYYQVEGDLEVEQISALLSGWSTARKWGHAVRALRTRTVDDVDVIYTRNFPTLFVAATMARPFAYETYRPWFDQFPPLRVPFRLAMRRPLFLGAVLHSHFARSRYESLGVAADRLEVVHNGFDPAQFEPRLSKQEARRRLDLPLERSIVTYTGHINATKGLDVVLKMAKRCPEVLFVLVGSQGRGVIERLAAGMDNVRIEPWQPFDSAVRHLFAADVLLQPPSGVPLRFVGNTVLPMKLFLYLAAGRPILAPRSPDTVELLEHGRNAVLVPPSDAEAAVVALRALLADPERARRMGDEALRSAEGLTWDARAERIERFLERRLSVVRAAVALPIGRQEL